MLVAEAAEIGVDLRAGATVLVARAHAHVAADDAWRPRVLAAVRARRARGAARRRWRRCARPPARRGPRSSRCSRAPRTPAAARAAAEVLVELQGTVPGGSFALGRSRVAEDPAELHRAAAEALLAANVAEGDEERPVLAFEETGAYRLLLSAMSEDPAELQRFYAETVEPLVAYDDQYDTDLVTTVEAYLDADGNVAGTAARLFTHRHTVRYRLERVRELSGLDVGVDRRPREAVAGPEGDAGPRRRPPRRPGDGAARGRARPAADLLSPQRSGGAPTSARRDPPSGQASPSRSATADHLRAGLQVRPRSADADPMTPWPRTRSPRVRARLAAVAGVLVAALLIAIGVAGLNSSVLGVKSWPALQRADRSGPAVLTTPDPSATPGAGLPLARRAARPAGRAARRCVVPGAGAGAVLGGGTGAAAPSGRRRAPPPAGPAGYGRTRRDGQRGPGRRASARPWCGRPTSTATACPTRSSCSAA